MSVCLLPQAYSVYDEEIGYCQGQSFLAAVLLLHVSSHISRVQKNIIAFQTISRTGRTVLFSFNISIYLIFCNAEGLLWLISNVLTLGLYIEFRRQ